VNATLDGVEDSMACVLEALLLGSWHDSQKVEESVHHRMETLYLCCGL
jgi:hypothetical protein